MGNMDLVEKSIIVYFKKNREILARHLGQRPHNFIVGHLCNWWLELDDSHFVSSPGPLIKLPGGKGRHADIIFLKRDDEGSNASVKGVCEFETMGEKKDKFVKKVELFNEIHNDDRFDKLDFCMLCVTDLLWKKKLDKVRENFIKHLQFAIEKFSANIPWIIIVLHGNPDKIWYKYPRFRDFLIAFSKKSKPWRIYQSSEFYEDYRLKDIFKNYKLWKNRHD